MNFAAQSFLVQVSTQKEGLYRLAEFGKSLVGRVLHIAAGEPAQNRFGFGGS
jgi:hypothetical protein